MELEKNIIIMAKYFLKAIIEMEKDGMVKYMIKMIIFFLNIKMEMAI